MNPPTPSAVTDEMVERAAIAIRRNKFERSRRLSVFDPTIISEEELGEARAGLTAALDGMAVVPREPTEAMLEAGEETFVSGMKGTPVSTPLDIWSAMLSAATPPAQGE